MLGGTLPDALPPPWWDRPRGSPGAHPKAPWRARRLLPIAGSRQLSSVGAVEADTAVETDTAVRFLDWPESVALGAAVAVTTRHGGVSEGPHGTLNLALH